MNVFSFSFVFSNCITTFSAHEEEDRGILGRGSWARDDRQRHLSLQANIPTRSSLHKHEAFGWIRSCLRNSQLTAHDGCPSPRAGVMLPGMGRAVLAEVWGLWLRTVVRCWFAEESAPGLDEEVVGGVPSRWCLLRQSCVGLFAVSPSSCVRLLLFLRNCSQLCLSPFFPGFLTQGVSRQMLRLATIPNSRCLAKIKTNRGKKTKNPQAHRAKFSGTAAAHTSTALAPGCPAAYIWPPPGREGGDTTGRILLPRREAQIWSLREAGRGENTS